MVPRRDGSCTTPGRLAAKGEVARIAGVGLGASGSGEEDDDEIEVSSHGHRWTGHSISLRFYRRVRINVF